jgi:Fic family protein
MEWLRFFLRSLRHQVAALEKKSKDEEKLGTLAPLSADLLGFARDRGTLTIRDAVSLTDANRNTIKLHVRNLVNRGLLRQEGKGKGTRYRPA